MKELIKPKGVYWNELSQFERDEISKQIPKLFFDPCYPQYRYYKTKFYNWIICNAFTVPMKLSKSVLS